MAFIVRVNHGDYVALHSDGTWGRTCRSMATQFASIGEANEWAGLLLGSVEVA
jgi:hypothetical protein